jgi:hypothetical protein
MYLNYKTPSLRCLAVYNGATFYEDYCKHVLKCVLCRPIAPDDVINQKYNVSLPCGLYFNEFPRSKCEAHLENCSICRAFAQSNIFPLSITEKAMVNYNILSKKDVTDSWKKLCIEVRSLDDLHLNANDTSDLDTKLAMLQTKLDKITSQTNHTISHKKELDAKKYSLPHWNEMLPLFFCTVCNFPSMKFMFADSSGTCVNISYGVSFLVDSGCSPSLPCFREIVSNKSIYVTNYNLDNVEN